MNCPKCRERMYGERSDYVIETAPLTGETKMMPQYHYRCEECDAEYVRTGWGKLRMLDCGDLRPEISAGGLVS